MRFQSIARGGALALLAGLATQGCAGSDPAPEDPAREPVTYENLYEREQYWPDQVMLTGPWKPEGFEGERFGYGLGILIRVEPSGDLRVDYARLGQHRVPARVTNVIEQANRIRVGEVHKPRPKFVFAVANKLLDPRTDPIRYVRPYAVDHIEAYLIVAADPSAEGFAEIVAALEPIRARRDVMLVLYPQGGHPDDQVLERCREVGWTDPFLFSRYVPGFTASILDDEVDPPGLVLQSPEGRVIHASAWKEGAPAVLAQRIEQELGPASTSATPSSAGGDGDRKGAASSS